MGLAEQETDRAYGQFLSGELVETYLVTPASVEVRRYPFLWPMTAPVGRQW
jgi:hypothetical protein